MENATGITSVKCLLVKVKHLLVQFVNLVEDWLTLINRSLLYRRLQLLYLFLLLHAFLMDKQLEFLCLGAELVVVQHPDFLIRHLHLLDVRLYELHIACRLITEQRLQKFCKVHFMFFVFISVSTVIWQHPCQYQQLGAKLTKKSKRQKRQKGKHT